MMRRCYWPEGMLTTARQSSAAASLPLAKMAKAVDRASATGKFEELDSSCSSPFVSR